MAPKKKVEGLIKLQIEAGQANPAPPVGPALGQPWRQHHGLLQGVQRRDGGQARAGHSRRDHRLRGSLVRLRAQDPTGRQIDLEGCRCSEGFGDAAHRQGRSITKDQVREIAETKMPDLNANDVDAAMRIIEGTARQMGITVS